MKDVKAVAELWAVQLQVRAPAGQTGFLLVLDAASGTRTGLGAFTHSHHVPH